MYWDDESWIWHYIAKPYGSRDFKKQYLPLYAIEQRQAVADTLRWYQQWFLAQNGYDFDERYEADDTDDAEETGVTIPETIRLVWQSES